MIKTGKTIKELRIGANMSQGELAEKIGAAQSTIAQYEKGSSKMSIEILMHVAQVLESSSDYILGLTDDPS